MFDYRCCSCNKLLFRFSHTEINFVVEIKCQRCNSYNVLSVIHTGSNVTNLVEVI
jgi:phage FluMu protein Com